MGEIIEEFLLVLKMKMKMKTESPHTPSTHVSRAAHTAGVFIPRLIAADRSTLWLGTRATLTS